MAIKNSQSKRMALANMLKQRPIYNQRMANFMSPASQQQAAAQAALGSQYIPSQDRNVLAAQAAQASQGGLSQPTQTQSVNPTQGQGQQYAQKNQFDFMSDLMSGQQQGAQQAAFMNNLMSGQPTQAQSVRPPLTGGAAVNRNKIQQPMPSTGLPKMNDTGFGNARGFNNNRVIPANMGQPKPLQSQAPATRPTNRGKLSQLAPTPGY